MSDPFDNVNLLRIIQEAETLFDKPGSEEVISQIRENLEVIMLLMLYTGTGGTATSDPPDDTTGYFYDTAAGWADDEHNGRSLVIIDGLAAGNIYTIDDTDDANDRLVCTGDNLYADGVRSGDKYKIFYNLKHTSSHTHDGVDSAEPVLADASVTQAKLKTSTGSVSRTTGGAGVYTIPGGEYAFFSRSRLYNASGSNAEMGVKWGRADIFSADEYWQPYTIATANDTGNELVATLYTDKASNTQVSAVSRYVTSSGEIHWIFIQREISTKNIISIWQAPDHPCFGNGGKPLLVPHPFKNHDPAKQEIICVNPSRKIMDDMIAAMAVADENLWDRELADIMLHDYNLDDSIEPPWPDIPVTVGLPLGWEMLKSGDPVTPIKKIIPKPPEIKTARLVLK